MLVIYIHVVAVDFYLLNFFYLLKLVTRLLSGKR